MAKKLFLFVLALLMVIWLPGCVSRQSDFLKTGLHILKAASGIDIHQMPALSGFANGRNAAFRNGAVGFFCECSVNVKKDNFFHICIINLSGIKVKKYIKGFDKSRKISVFKAYFL